MTKDEKRLNRWTEKMETIDGVVVRYLKAPQKCRTKMRKKSQKKQLQNHQEAS